VKGVPPIRLLVPALSLAALTLLAGCASGSTPPSTSPTQAPTSASSPAATAVATKAPAVEATKPAAAATTVPATRTVVGSDGKSVTVPSDPKRIAALRAPHTEILYALGAKDRIILVDESTKTGTSYGAFISSVYPPFKNVPTADVAMKLNVEEMLKAKPDLIITGGTSRMKDIDSIRQQTSIPLVVAHLELLDTYMSDIRLLAKVANAEAKGEEIVKLLQARLDGVQTKVKDIPDKDKTKVFYGCFDAYHAYGADNFEDTQIKVAGGKNVAAETTGWAPEVSAEQLMKWNPDVMIIAHYKDDYKLENVMNDPKLANISAVKNKRVYLLPDATWEFMSPNAILAIEWVGGVLYPDRFKEVDVKADADAFYQALYGVKYTNPLAR
jgi:iron complex transport system substrate-binding protein